MLPLGILTVRQHTFFLQNGVHQLTIQYLKLRKRTLYFIIMLGGAILIIVAIVHAIWYYHSPEAVRDETIGAMESGDVQTLCNLADKRELQRLNITPQSVQNVLNVTLWRIGYPTGVRKIELVSPTPQDQSIWNIYWDSPHPKRLMWIELIKNRNGSWKLILSALLKSACFYAAGNVNVQQKGIILFRQLGAANGIRGQRAQDGTYYPL